MLRPQVRCVSTTMILNVKAKQIRLQVEDAVKDLHQLVEQIGHKELSATLGELRNRMTEPFMFVIVGEVKAGRSSFINALRAMRWLIQLERLQPIG
jgi:tRNA U34 5-carboxymethylaminomethyl modifying GTPase MnmE/TrmE